MLRVGARRGRGCTSLGAVSGIFSISIVPLETLPGWPAADQLSGLQLLLGIIGIPVGLALLLALLVYAPALAKRGDDKSFARKPLWLGAVYSPGLAHLNRTVPAHGAGAPATRQSWSYLEEPGASFNSAEIEAFKSALVEAEDRSGMRFCLFVGGPDGDPKEFAKKVISGQREPASSVVLVVDPDSLAVEVATGTEAARRISDAECARAASTIQQEVALGKTADGILAGLNLLGRAGRDLPNRRRSSEFALEH
ncbi:uncharacterized protein DUF5130 [Naumannella halotolerans]|uniref:Uncharacterized protein DUF5130 n=1 Tax=Naumannella halotolerans TaxID=993414 RepID=A0A4R7J941_9ACTN|nr:uncharacterized protein DUF5130 [Naumannella halotolerans]